MLNHHVRSGPVLDERQVHAEHIHQQKCTALALWFSGWPDHINNSNTLWPSFLRSGQQKSGPVVALPSGDLFGSVWGLFGLVASSARPFQFSRCSGGTGENSNMVCS
jgi:hypothetical protein